MATTRLGSFTVNYHNLEEYHHIKREIFVDHIYYIESENPTPLIIDAGAHIGLATLYFKNLFPAARIIAIEPNPTSFKLLEQNVWDNGLTDVRCINAALVDDERQSITMHEDRQGEWLMTTSIHEGAWSGDQSTRPVQVPAIQLSSLLTEPVELLKMDIEGSERRVLRGIANYFHLISHLRMEFHATAPRSLKNIETLLKPHFSDISFSKRKQEIEDLAQFTGLCFVAADK